MQPPAQAYPPPYAAQQQVPQYPYEVPYTGPQASPPAVGGGTPGPQGYAGYVGYPYLAPPARKRTGLVIGLTVGVVVVVAGGIGAYAALGGSSSPAGSTSALAGRSSPSAPSTGSATTDAATSGASSDAAGAAGSVGSASAITLPSHADGLVLLTDSLGKQVVSRVRTGVSTGGAIYAKAEIGAYGPGSDGGYRLVLVDQPMINMSADLQNEMNADPPSDFVKQVATAVSLSGTQVESSTDPIAAISCGTLDKKGVKVLTCLWDDLQSFGFAYFYDSYYTTSISAAAHYTDQLRAAAEGN